MHRNQELLDFEVDPVAGDIRILDAPDADDALLSSLGLNGPDREASVAGAIRDRCISGNRLDRGEILDAFGARSSLELAFMGHGLSLADKLWYRTPGSTERWEDINFLDNVWDTTFYTKILTHDYKGLASCSPDIPDVTLGGRLRKAWERTEDGIFLLKEPSYEGDSDLEGEKLAAKLCLLLYGEDDYQPLSAVERYGRRFSASPLMVGRDEELVQGWRLYTMGGFDKQEMKGFWNPITSQQYINIISRAGVPNARTYVAKVFAFFALAILLDFHSRNYGIIRNLETGECRAALPFDYDHAFGFPPEKQTLEVVCGNPFLASLFIAKEFSDLDPSWDWSWYDPQALEGFEGRIKEAYSHLTGFPSNFADLVAQAFVVQRDFVNNVASKGQ